MYIVYTLLSFSNPSRYVGFTDNPEKRLKRHNNGLVRSTSANKPYGMLLLREVDTRSKARMAEKYFKSGFGRKHLDRLLKREDISSRLRSGRIIDLSRLSE